MNTNDYSFVVKFEASKDQVGCVAFVNGRPSFPQRGEQQPQAGESWLVEKVGENPRKTVFFLRLISKVELKEWTWNDKIGSRERKPACLIVSPKGDVYRFTGFGITGVVQVTNSSYEKNGKWSNTTYTCVSPQGTAVYSWRQDFENGKYWPQASWEEAFATVRAVAPQVNISSLEAIIREEWGGAAKTFDENRSAIQQLAQMSVTTSVEDQGDEVKLVEWSFNDGRLSRGYTPVCYVVTPDGRIHKFKGESITGVVKVLKANPKQDGKWSSTTYNCVSPTGCTIVTWSQNWNSGLYWPQTSWEEAINWFQSQAPQATEEEIEALVRRYKEPSARKFDEHRAATASFSQTEGLPKVLHLIEEGRSISYALSEMGISTPTEFEAGKPSVGISGTQANTLVAGEKAMVIFSIGPNGGVRYRYEECGSSGLTILMEEANSKSTAKQVVAIVESPDWYSAWINYKDGEITSYVLANAGGVHSCSPQWDGIQTRAWEGIPVNTPSDEDEMSVHFGLKNTTKSQVEENDGENSAMNEALRKAGLL